MGTSCAICGEGVAGDRSAICESADGSVVHYQDFVEDLRASFDRISHPTCWAREHGVERLIEIIESRNAIERRGFWEMVDRMDAMEQKLVQHRLRPPD